MPAQNAPIVEAIDSLGKDWAQFKASQGAAMKALGDRTDRLEAGASGPFLMSAPSSMAASAEYKSFTDYLRTGRGLDQKDATTGTASGAFVPKVVATDIIAKALARSRIGELVRNTAVESGDYTRIVRLGGATSGWSSETASRAPTTEAQYRAITPTHGELYGYFTATNWALQDASFDLAKELTDAIVAQFAKDLEAAIISGNGSSRPTGMLATNPVTTDDGASPQRPSGVYEYVPSGAAGTLGHAPSAGSPTYGDDRLLDLFFTLRPEYRQNATWIMASPTLAAVRKFKDTSGQPIWQPNMTPGVDQGDGFLFGKPVVVCESVPAISANSFAIGVGDLQQAYELVRIHGLDLTRDEVTSPGKTKFYVRARFGGSPLDNDALKFLKCAAS